MEMIKARRVLNLLKGFSRALSGAQMQHVTSDNHAKGYQISFYCRSLKLKGEVFWGALGGVIKYDTW